MWSPVVPRAPHLAVARIRKPHGLKGEAVCWVLTDDPDAVLAPGRRLTPVDESGRATGASLEIERSRRYQRGWLLKFRGVDDRTSLEGWRELLLGVPAEELEPPGGDELYRHEIPGARVLVAGQAVGVALDLVAVPGGELLAVEVGGREVLVPFRRPIVRRIDRAARVIELDPPTGLLEL